jgi:pimeloyl-ACP methyl ester carboxylesterase
MHRMIAVLVAMTGLVHQPVAAQQAPSPRRTYVIVHGAWGGAWDWRRVDSMLTAQGHLVYRVQLTGLGERVHLASSSIGLATHIDDVVNTLVWENLRNVVLLGHSYGGMVITGVADRVPDRIAQLIYLDAFVPDSGESVFSFQDSAGAAFFRANTRDGFIVPPWVTDVHVTPRDVPQPLHTFTDTLRLINPDGRKVPATYILTVDPGATSDPFQRYADRAAARGWRVLRMEADHIPERSAPAALVELLGRIP